MRTKQLLAWSKILRPPCFGEWNCLINPENPFYEEMKKAPSNKVTHDDICPCMDECLKRNNKNAEERS